MSQGLAIRVVNAAATAPVAPESPSAPRQGCRERASLTPAMSQAQRWVRRYRFPLTAFAASRLALLLVGLLTQVYVLPVADASKALSPSKHEAMNIWARWDSGWYMDLAAHGYHAATSPGGQANWAFFPAYPGMAAAIAHLSGV